MHLREFASHVAHERDEWLNSIRDLRIVLDERRADVFSCSRRRLSEVERRVVEAAGCFLESLVSHDDSPDLLMASLCTWLRGYRGSSPAISVADGEPGSVVGRLLDLVDESSCVVRS